MSVTQQDIALIARQHLEGLRLTGVDFVPLSPKSSVDSSEPPQSQATEFAASVVAAGGNPATRFKADALEQLRARHDAACPHCTTARYHTRTVFGEGDPSAALMFVGEAPGEEEDRTGRPFVGRAGQKLDDIIKAMGMARQQVYIANILKSRPPENRTPLPTEVDACVPFLAQQIRIIQPRVIVALGGPAAKTLLKTETGITRLRGQWGSYVDELLNPPLRIPVMPTFHPAYILRNYTVDTRKKVWSDMQAVLARLAETSPV